MADIQKLSKDKTSETALETRDKKQETDNSKTGDVSRKAKDQETVSEDKELREGKESPEKGKELPEPLRPGDGKGVMPGLPPIDITELTTMLRSPSMPSHKIMKEVADKMMLKSEESESDDGSVGSSGGVGMKGLFDCILEVSLLHPDSDNSEEEDDPDESIPREIPCKFCNKVFGSTMSWKTHVLVAHPQQDPSVLNIRRLSINEPDARGCRRKLKSSSKSDCDRDTKSRHPSKSDMKGNCGVKGGEENVPVNKRRSSLSKPQLKAVPVSKPEPKGQQMSSLGVAEPLPKEEVPVKSGDTTEVAHRAVSSPVESKLESPTHATTNQPAEKVLTAEQSSQKRKVSDEKQTLTSSKYSTTSNPPTSEISSSDDQPIAKKEKNTSSSSQLSSLQPSSSVESETHKEHSEKSTMENPSSAPKHKLSDNTCEVITKKARVAKSKKADKPPSVPSRRSTRHK